MAKTQWTKVDPGAWATTIKGIVILASKRPDGQWFGHCEVNGEAYNTVVAKRSEVVDDLSELYRKHMVANWPPQEPPKIETIGDWHRVLLSGDNIVSIPRDSSSENISQSSKTAGPKYVAQDSIALLIELHYGIWPKDDASVVKKAVRLVANHTKKSSAVVWRMTFEVCHPALADAILCKRLGGPPTSIQRAVWITLDGCAMKTAQLENEVAGGVRNQLYYPSRKLRKGGLTELQAVGLVVNKKTVGYYRPDAPPVTF